MRQTKTFRLSAETIEYLKQKDNASTYIEHLIELDRQTPDGANYIKKPESGGSGTITLEYLDKQFNKLAELVGPNDIGKASFNLTNNVPTTRPVYHGKFLVGQEDVKHRDCLCPYEVNERGLNERSGTADECPIHGDSVGFEDLL